METTYENILPIVNSFSDIEKPFTTTIYKNWHTIASDTTPTIWPSKPLSTYTKPSHSQPSCLLHTNTWLTTTQFLTYIHLHTPTHRNTFHSGHPPPLSAGEEVELRTEFSKRGRELDRTSTFTGGLLGKREWLFHGGGGGNFHIKINESLKYLMTKKVYNQNIFLCHN